MAKRTGLGFTTLELVVIFTVVILLGGFVASKYEAIRQTRRDDERKNDIAALQLGIQSYWAQTGNFPALSQMDSSTFRTASLNNVKDSAAQDPRWNAHNKNCTLAGKVQFEQTPTPHTGCYGYVPSPAGCDNKVLMCVGYELDARLESGKYFTKSGS